ncbi:hypothetical protein SEA_ATUIN_185 [Arthrobacter phage Atuin]|nr:hypothetical protein SEA_ATUIN_284 [Arthrobacter phage Atuin]
MSENLTDQPESFNYLVHYSFKFPESGLRPHDQSFGTGSIPINTDHAIETPEDLKEVSRQIGKLGGYEMVAINNYERTDKFIDDSSEILEGLVVND